MAGATARKTSQNSLAPPRITPPLLVQDESFARSRAQAATSTRVLATRVLDRTYPIENEVPQPQDLVALGLLKVKPCRITVSS